MADKQFRAFNGKLVATLRESGNGSTLYDSGFTVLGRYDKSQDKTYDNKNNPIARGNCLERLVPCN